MGEMYIHDTPLDIGRILARHAPRKVSSLLDPAVGRGALLEALLGSLDDSIREIFCIDTNDSALKHVYDRFVPLFGHALKAIHSDFLEWHPSTFQQEDLRFDCVVMNPPFSGRLNGWVQYSQEEPSALEKPRPMPLEAAFVLKALSLLKKEGRLLSIVPGSLVSSEKMIWFRKLISDLGSVDYVYEMPKFSFKGVEARPYLVIITKGLKQGSIKLVHKNCEGLSNLVITKSELSRLRRYDYGFCQASRTYELLKTSFSDLKWSDFGDVIELHRGGICSPLGKRSAIHTTNYKSGFWRIKEKNPKIIQDKSVRGVKQGDLVIKRVGRNCAGSIGVPVDLKGLACSDCLFILRPKEGFDSIKILLALRFILCSTMGRSLLERGTGASYLTEATLKGLSIPVGIADRHVNLFRRYLRAIRSMVPQTMMSIENELQSLYGISRLN